MGRRGLCWLVALGGCATPVAGSAVDAGDHDYVLVNARQAPLVIAGGAPECDAPCSLVHVDGFDNSLDEARANFSVVADSYHRAGGTCRLYGFAWRSDFGLRHFAEAEDAADGVAGPALAQFLRTVRAMCGTRPVHLMGHSLAARVIMRAVVPEEAVRVETASLVAPAVLDDGLAIDGEFARSLPQIGHTYVLFNTQDHVVLGSIFPMASRSFRWPLGLHGNRGATPASVTEVDFSKEWGWGHSLRHSLSPSLWAYLLPRIAAQGLWN